MCRPNSPLRPGRQLGVAALDPSQHAAEVAVGDGLDDAEVDADEAGPPLGALADGPDDPELVRAALDGLLEVGVREEDGIDVGVAVRRTGGNHIGMEMEAIRRSSSICEAGTATSSMLGEVVEVEAGLPLGGPDARPVEAPRRQEVAAEPVEGQQRIGPEELPPGAPVEPDAAERPRSLRQLSAMVCPLMPWHHMARLRLPPEAPSAWSNSRPASSSQTCSTPAWKATL